LLLNDSNQELIKPYQNSLFFYLNTPYSKIKDYDKWKDEFKKNNIEIEKNEINFLNFRSDNFIKEHNKKHILFSGCSQTFGVGLKKHELWSYKLYNKINNIEKCSGYFNLAVPGSSIPNIVINLFKYFEEYGNPDTVFFNLPNTERFYNYDKDTKNFYDSMFSNEYSDFFNLLSYQYYFMLSKYCKSNKIKLISFSWHEKTTHFMSDKFKDFVRIPNNESISFIFDKYKKDEDFIITARDGIHLGIGFNDYWAERAYHEYTIQDLL
jgi:hypothetical protein